MKSIVKTRKSSHPTTPAGARAAGLYALKPWFTAG